MNEILAAHAGRILYALFCDWALNDHEATGVETISLRNQSGEHSTASEAFGPFLKWDSVYYINIVLGGRKKESDFAFFPLYPAILKQPTRLLIYMGFSQFVGVQVCGIMLGLVACCIAYSVLKCWLGKIGVRSDLIAISGTSFCFNPAGIFFTTLYTEAPFSAVSWVSFWCLENRQYFLSIATAVVACFMRSNGNLVAIVFVMKLLQLWVNGRLISSRADAAWLGLGAVAVQLPYIWWNWVTYNALCSDRSSSSALEVEASTLEELCSAPFDLFRLPYPYLQRKHWGVGFLRYYQWKQLPNFLLAAPIAAVALYTVYISVLRGFLGRAGKDGLWPAVREAVEHPLMPYVVHMLAVLGVGALVAHVQVLTRLLCSACPLIYVGMAYALTREERVAGRSLRQWMMLYLLAYNLVGVLLHVNFYPWT